MLRPKIWFAFGGVMVVIAGAFAFWYLKAATLSCDCSVETLQEVLSPDRKYVATLFERNCGATTPNYRVVILRPAGTKLNTEKPEDWVFSVKQRTSIQLKWEDDHHLTIFSYATDESPIPHRLWKEIEITQKSPSS